MSQNVSHSRDMQPQPCAICDQQGAVGVNGAWFCLDHIDDGFRMAARAVAIIHDSLIDSQRLDQAEAKAVEMAADLIFQEKLASLDEAGLIELLEELDDS